MHVQNQDPTQLLRYKKVATCGVSRCCLILRGGGRRWHGKMRVTFRCAISFVLAADVACCYQSCRFGSVRETLSFGIIRHYCTRRYLLVDVKTFWMWSCTITITITQQQRRRRRQHRTKQHRRQPERPLPFTWLTSVLVASAMR